MVRISKNPEERKEEIITTAEHLFFRKGIEKTAISDIVRSIGIAQGTFYYHFKSKQEVLEAVINKNISLVEKGANAILQKEKCSPMKRITKFIEYLFHMEEKQKNILQYLHEEKNRALHEKILMGFLKRMTEPLVNTIEEGKKLGEIHIKYSYEGAEFLISAIGYLSHCAELEGNQERRERLQSTCLDMAHKMFIK